MAGLKELKIRLQSVRNTKKITYAMKLVSAAKLKKAQDAVTRARAYTSALSEILAEVLSAGGSEFSHPLLEPREAIRAVRLLVIGGSRGLCGGYNTNVNKKIESAYAELKRKYPGVEIQAQLLGRKPAEHFRRLGRPYQSSMEQLPEDVYLWPIDELCLSLERDYREAKFDECYIIFTRFKSALSVTPQFEKLLPLDPDIGGRGGAEINGAGLFEPSPQTVFASIIPRMLRTKIRQACLDAKASEQGSRMTAMDSATKNASDLIYRLQLTYNQLRQESITGELLDIIGGAEALN